MWFLRITFVVLIFVGGYYLITNPSLVGKFIGETITKVGDGYNDGIKNNN